MRHLISCCQLGVSAFVGEISSAVITFIFNMLILGLTGSTGVAAYGVVANLSLVGMAIMNGMAQGVQPLISESFGKGAFDDVKTSSLGSDLCSGDRSYHGCTGMEFLQIRLFRYSTVKIISCFWNMRMLVLGYISWDSYLPESISFLSHIFSATANARPAIIGSLLRGAVAIGACAIVLSMILGMNGVWLSFPASEVITLIMVLILARHKESRKTNAYV